MRPQARHLAAAGIALISVLPGIAGAQYAPTILTSVENVTATWHSADPGGPRYPTMIAFDGRLDVDTYQPTVFDRDTWGPTHFVSPSDMVPDAADDAIVNWSLRGTATPIKLELLNDLGVQFHVADLAPFGTAVRWGQGAVHEPYMWGGVSEGSQAFDGNVSEAFFVHEGMPSVFPDRPAAETEGELAWDHATTMRSPTSRAYDPTTSSFYSTSLVSAVSTSTLTVRGGDLTQPAHAEDFSLVLPEEVDPFGAFAIYPSGMPGVPVSFSISYPGIAQRDFHELLVQAEAEPEQAWPETRAVGPLREWGWRPLVVNYGFERSMGAGRMASFQAPVPPGSEILALDLDGTVRRLGPVEAPSFLEVTNVEGRQRLELLESLPAGHSAAPGNPGGSAPSGDAQGEAILSPEVRGLLPPGVVSATLRDREDVPVLAGLKLEEQGFGDVSVPYAVVDGVAHKLTRAALAAPPQVTPLGWDDGHGSFYGSGFDVRILARAGPTMLELAWVPLLSSFWSIGYLYVIDTHSTDGQPHAVDVLWASRPDADRFQAQGVELPVETVTHEEFNGDLAVENRPDIVAVDGAGGGKMRYFQLVPAFFWSLQTASLHGYFAMIVDPGAFTASPIDEVDNETLRGDVALYASQRYEGFEDTAYGGGTYRGSIYLLPA